MDLAILPVLSQPYLPMRTLVTTIEFGLLLAHPRRALRMIGGL
jgi:hypothetical protein